MSSTFYSISVVVAYLVIGSSFAFAQPSNPPSTERLQDIIRSASESMSQMGSQSQNRFSSPFIDSEKARSMSYDNRVKQAQTYYERKRNTARWKDEIKQERLERTQRNAAASRQRAKLRKKPKPSRMNADQLDPVSGEISWPVVLITETYEADRTNVDELYPKHLESGGGINSIEYAPIKVSLLSIKSTMNKNRSKILPEQYSYARKFLESLMNEAKLAVD